MNRVALALAAVCSTVASAFLSCRAESELFTYVTNEWHQCRKENVLRVATERLATNADDVVGLLLKLEYDMAFADNATFTNSVERFRTAAKGVSTPAFRACARFLQQDLDSLVFFATNAPSPGPSQDDVDKAKRVRKRMNFLEEFKALDEDGFTAREESRQSAPLPQTPGAIE